MKDSHTKPFENLFHPYIFVLKEGKEIQDDFLDYSLLLLQVGQADTLRSPNSKSASSAATQFLRR